jgi:hypothetical protein
MKRLIVFVFLGPILFVLCVWFVFLPLAIFLEGEGVRFDIEVDSYLAVLLGVMFGGFVLAIVDWIAEMLVMRPWFTGIVGWAIGALTIGAWFDLSRSIWWWFVVKGLLVGIPALACSWLAKRKQKGSTSSTQVKEIN